MGSTRKSFTDEYRAEVVAFVLGSGRTIAEVSRNIGCHEMTLGKWVKKAREERDAAVPKDAPLSESECQRLIRVEVELKAAIANWADSKTYPVTFMCEQLGVSRSGSDAWRGRGASQRSKDDATRIAIMKTPHAQGRGDPASDVCGRAWPPRATGCSTTGSTGSCRPLTCEDANPGLGSAPRSERPTRSRPPTSSPGGSPPRNPTRNGAATFPHRGAAGGAPTYVKTWDRWVCLATVIDLRSCKIISRAVADRMRTALVTAALDMAVTTREPPPGVIFHSDRGAQYTSKAFDDYCRKHNIRRPLGPTGTCYDDAVSESFFATYKKELVHTRPWPTLQDLLDRTRDWIENYYDTTRRHPTLNYLTPQEYELVIEITQPAHSLNRCPPKRGHTSLWWCGVVVGGGDHLDHLHGLPARPGRGVLVLGGECGPGRGGQDLDRAVGAPAVALLDGSGGRRVPPGRVLARGAGRGPVGPEGEDMIAADGGDGPGGVGPGARRVHRHHRIAVAGRVETRQGCSHGGDLVAPGLDPWPARDGAGGVVERRHQVRCCGGNRAGAPRGLAVDGDHPADGRHDAQPERQNRRQPVPDVSPAARVADTGQHLDRGGDALGPGRWTRVRRGRCRRVWPSARRPASGPSSNPYGPRPSLTPRQVPRRRTAGHRPVSRPFCSPGGARE